VGYVAFEVSVTEAHGPATLVVLEMATHDDVTRRVLLGALSALRDQVVSITLEIDAADPLELGLLDSDAHRHGTEWVEHDLGTLVGGPLVRVEDVSRAIEARGYFLDGAFDLVVREDDGTTLAVSVEIEGGRASVSAARAEARNAFRTTRQTLATLLFGGLSAVDAFRMGLAEADSRVVDRVSSILALPPSAPPDAF
jgi:predicted acetyltransferase